LLPIAFVGQDFGVSLFETGRSAIQRQLVRLPKPILSVITGIIAGGLIGAAILGGTTYLDQRCGFLGCGKDWAMLAGLVGLFYGALVGAVTGVVIGLGSFNGWLSAGAGATIGSVITILLFIKGAAGDPFITAAALLAVPGGALVGLIVFTICGRRRRGPDTKPERRIITFE
jgi:hypothetical protein